MTGEENWTNFFARNANDDTSRTANENLALKPYGCGPGSAQAYAWNTVASADDKYARWNTSVTGTSTDGTDDYRHEINGQGYITEIDPYNPTSVIKKRTPRWAARNAASISKVAVASWATMQYCRSSACCAASANTARAAKASGPATSR